MNPGDVIEHQGRIVTALMDGRTRWNLAATMVLRFQRLVVDQGLDHFNSLAEHLLTREAGLVNAAHSFHVTAEMTELINSASAALMEQRGEYTLSLAKHDLPTEVGFAVFDQPLLIKDELTHVISPISAISWGPSGPPDDFSKTGHVVAPESAAWVSVTGWMARQDVAGYMNDLIKRNQRDAQDANDRLDEYRRVLGEVKAAIDASDLTQAERHELEQQIADNLDAEKTVEMEFRYAREMLDSLQMMVLKVAELPRSLSMLPFEVVIVPCSTVAFREELMNNARAYGNVRVGLTHMAWVFWHMCQQTLTDTREEQAPRAFARRWKQMKFPKRITVVTLRRKRSGSPEGPAGNVEWSHRWLVRGHWRMQPYGPGRAEKRPVWIPTHVKGPEDKPLFVSQKIYDLRR